MSLFQKGKFEKNSKALKSGALSSQN